MELFVVSIIPNFSHISRPLCLLLLSKSYFLPSQAPYDSPPSSDLNLETTSLWSPTPGYQMQTWVCAVLHLLYFVLTQSGQFSYCVVIAHLLLMGCPLDWELLEGKD